MKYPCKSENGPLRGPTGEFKNYFKYLDRFLNCLEKIQFFF